MEHAESAQNWVEQVQGYMQNGDEDSAKRIWANAYDRAKEDLGSLYAADENVRAYSNVSEAIESLAVAKEALKRMGLANKWAYRRGGER